MDPKLRSCCRFGAYCALVAGASYTGMVICAFLMPPSVASYMATDEYFADFGRVQPLFIALKCLMLVAAGALIFAPVWSVAEGVYLLKISRKGLPYLHGAEPV